MPPPTPNTDENFKMQAEGALQMEEMYTQKIQEVESLKKALVEKESFSSSPKRSRRRSWSKRSR